MAKPGKKRDRLGQVPVPATVSAEEWSALLDDGSTTSPEEIYRTLAPLEHRRRLAQFFTPPRIADLMAGWVSAHRPRDVLDPAVGPGVFVRAIREHVPEARVTAIDIDPFALDAAKAGLRGHGTVEFVHADFLTWNTDATFDAILANPPYLKHHDMLYAEDIHARIGSRNGIRLSRLTNIYALFIIEACRRLRPGGRAAIIVPGEWTNSNFGLALKEFLLSRGFLKKLIYFSHAQTVFDDALTTASVLLLERCDKRPSGAPDSVTTAFVEGECPMDALEPLFTSETSSLPGVVVRNIPCQLLLSEKKWNHLLKHGPSSSEPGWVPLSVLASTRRGIATGANQFFHVSAPVLEKWDIAKEHATPCVGRANEIEGLLFDAGASSRLEAKGARAFLLNFAAPPALRPSERAYLARGEAEGLPARYLLAARSPWYAMEDRPVARIWAAVFGRKGLRFVWNQTETRNLTTFHCIYPRSPDPTFAGALVGLLNSRKVQSRSGRQHRVYGGGLLKFEPKDLLDIQVPDLRLVAAETLTELAAMVARLDGAVRTGNEPSKLLDRLDDLVARAAREASASSREEPVQAPRRPIQGHLQLG